MMPAVLKASLAFHLRHPWQLFLAIVGVCAGVAVIVAVDLTNSSSRIAFLDSLESVSGAATHQVVGGPAGIDESLYVTLRREHAYDRIAPIVEADVEISERSFTLLGVDLFAEQMLRDFRFDATPDGDEIRSLFADFLVKPGGIVLSRSVADDLGLVAGDSIAVAVRGRIQQGTMIGTLDDGGTLQGYVLADLATAQEWLDAPGTLSRIDVRLEPEATGNFKQLLPGNVRLLDAEGRTRTTLEMSEAFMVNLKAMSLLALLVGLFLIYNSASFSVVQRRSLLGVLRALGVTRKQAFLIIIGEAAVLGIVAGAIGVLVGVWLGEQLLFYVTRTINDLYFRVAVTSVTISEVTVAKGLLAGFCAALVAAAVPAYEAAKSPPQLAINRSSLEGRVRRTVPRIAVAGVVMLMLAAATLGLSASSLVAGLSAIFLLILGFALLIPWFVQHLGTLLAPLAGRMGGIPARLAVAEIAGSLSRTGVAIVALAVAVSATIGVSVMVDSFRGSVNQWLTRTLQADIYAGLPGGGVDPDLATAMSSLPEVAAVSTSRRVLFPGDARDARVRAIRMAPGSYAGIEILDALPDEVWPRWESDDVVLVSEPYGYRNGITAGTVVSLPTDRGSVSFEVVATYQSYDVNGSGILMSRDVYDRHWNDDRIDSIGLYLADGTDVDETIRRLESLGAAHGQDLFINSNVDIRELSLSIFDRTFVITNILYWLALGVAVVGILGAMLALQLERSRELGLLRALGMTPRELGSNIAFQTGTIGFLSGLVSIPLGLLMAWILIDVINRRAFGWHISVDIPALTVFAGLGLAVGSGLLAGLYPAWRAARTQPALAMREE